MPAKAAVKPRARDVRVQELTHHGQKVIERYQQCLAQRHSHDLLRRRQCGLKPMRCVAAILDGCRACAICRSSGASPRSARPAPSRPRRLPGSPPAPWASLLLGCEDGSTCRCPVPNVPQHRSCHEKGGSPRGNVIIRDETVRFSCAFYFCDRCRGPVCRGLSASNCGNDC